jgi:hypothetical protein
VVRVVHVEIDDEQIKDTDNNRLIISQVQVKPWQARDKVRNDTLFIRQRISYDSSTIETSMNKHSRRINEKYMNITAFVRYIQE